MLPEYVKFYYDKLPDIKKNVYMQMYTGLKNHKKQIAIQTDKSLIKPDDLQYIFTCLYNDTPSFYFVDPGPFSYGEMPGGYIFANKYIYTAKEIRQFDRLVEAGLLKFRDQYIGEGLSDYEKELVIHDYLVRTVTYDEESLKREDLVARHGEIFNILGPLLRKKAVCWGIACAFKLICDFCRLKCFVIVGDALPVNPDAGHAWNMVKIDDENYHVDVTWDIKKKGDISFSYDYLNLDDHLIRMNHTWDDAIYPVCKALQYNYYVRHKLFVRTLAQIPEYVRGKIAAGGTHIVFKFANNMPARSAIEAAVYKGVSLSKQSGAYAYMINTDTHNVYIELKSSDRP